MPVWVFLIADILSRYRSNRGCSEHLCMENIHSIAPLCLLRQSINNTNPQSGNLVNVRLIKSVSSSVVLNQP